MYVYTDFDQQMVNERVAQFASQTQRYLAGELSDDEYRPLRLQNGLYVQRYAPMLRIAVPYGLYSSQQLRTIARISRTYDRGYAHVSTRQNFQLNWLALQDAPAVLAELATVQMHAIQTSGNCIRNTTTDQFAGVCANEVLDPRPTCEIIRQWSTFHPEFAFLPRKFKIAVNANPTQDRAATALHDLGVYIYKNQNGETRYRILAGGGLGRTPIVGSVIREDIAQTELIAYLEAVLRVYNLYGRRDNKYKARIKILVKALGPDVFAAKVEEEFGRLKDTLHTDISLWQQMESRFVTPAYALLEDADLSGDFASNAEFKRWYAHNTTAHKVPGYRIVTINLKRAGVAPGDVTDVQMEQIAQWADDYSFGELRNTHEQNIVLADVRQTDLLALFKQLQQANMARAHIGFITDVVSCPGGDYCSLANAKSIPIAEALIRHFDDLDSVYAIGPLDFNISGCMNACGHHHVGHIGILGVDKKGDEFYQIALGGDSGHNAAIGDILGPSFRADDVVSVVEEITNTYLDLRQKDEQFIETYRRVGIEPFKERVYAAN